MGKITKVILVKHAVETLGYFSEQIAMELVKLGYDIYFIDYDKLYESICGLSKFAQKGHTAFLTFNYIGLGKEEIFRDESGRLIWEAYEMQYFNILADHPLYYHAGLLQDIQRLTVFCVDKEHAAYIRRFYPWVDVSFLPLAGNIWLPQTKQSAVDAGKRFCNYEQKLIPYEKRSYDVVFAANYVPIAQLEQQFFKLDAEYAAFYREIAEDLLAKPAQALDVVLERHIREELGDVSDSELRGALAGMVLVDLYVRTSMRGDIVRKLTDADIRVHVFGADWEKLACRKPENLVKTYGQVSSAVCVDAMQNAKLSLNVLPWFKDGAHDRIFTAMLQKAVALTDDSRYLREEFTDGRELVFFSLKKRENLPDIVHRLLCDEKNAARIAANGYQWAVSAHTWSKRADLLAEKLRGF